MCLHAVFLIVLVSIFHLFLPEVKELIFALLLPWTVCFLVHFASSDVTDPPRSKVEVLAMERGRDGSQQKGHCLSVLFWKSVGLFLVSIMNWGKVAFTGWGHGC